MVMSECPFCGFPTNARIGANKVCANCNESMITGPISDVTIPTGLFWGTLAFVAGVILGPVLLSSSSEGQRWLERQAKRKLGG